MKRGRESLFFYCRKWRTGAECARIAGISRQLFHWRYKMALRAEGRTHSEAVEVAIVWDNERRCSKCREPGHYKVTCKA